LPSSACARCARVFVAACLTLAGSARAANCISVADGNWNNPATWSCTGAPAAPGGVPGAADNVAIDDNDSVTITANAAALSVTFPAGNQASDLTHNAGVSLAVGAGGVTINGGTAGAPLKAWNINAGSATVNGPVTLNGGNANNRIARINLTSGTLDINGDLAMNTADSLRAVIAATGAANISVAGSFTQAGNLGTLTQAATGTFTYDTAAAASVATGAAVNYTNLVVDKPGGVATTVGNLAVANSLSVTAGTLAVTGTLALAAGASASNSGIVSVSADLTGGNAAVAWTNAAGSTLNVAGALLATATLTASANGNTVNYNGAGNQAVKLPVGGDYFHLTLSTGGIKTPEAGTYDIGGNLTVDTGATLALNTNNPVVNLAGNMIHNGTFTAGTGLFTFNGAAAQSLSGSAANTGFINLTVNNTAALATRTVTLAAGHDATVSGALTFTSGRIVTTATSKVIIPAGGSVAGAAGSPNDRFVAGRLQKFVAAGNTTVTFEIGTDGAVAPQLGYTPVTLSFTGAAAGSLIASGALGDHPQLGSSGLDPALSVNRWWQLVPAGVSFASVSPTFTFIGTVDPSGGVDAGVDTTLLEIERWDGAAWQVTTVGARSATSTQATGLTALGDFAIAHKVPVIVAPGDLNAFEPATAAGAIVGQVYTKLAGTNFTLDVVAILAGAQHAAFSDTVQVDLVSGSTGGLNCPGAPVAVAGTLQSVALTNGRGATGTFNVATAHRDLRVRIRWPVGAPTVTSCSTDNFAIRPLGLAVSSTNATQTGSAGVPAIRTGANFNLTAASGVIGYDGTPAIDNAQVVGTPTAGAIGGVFAAAPAATGTALGNAFFYSEVGNFGLNANAVYDAAFTNVDQASGDCVAGFSNVPAGGRYGCAFGSAAIAQATGASGFGRFIPDNFAVAYNVPQLATACATFTYVGQPVAYSTAPVITVTARNGSNNGLTNATTLNYAGAYMKLGNASLAPATQAARYARFDALGGGTTPALDTGALPAVAADPAIGVLAPGVINLTFSSGSGLAFSRPLTAPSAPFNADIALALDVVDADGVAFAGNPASFGAAAAGNGMAFDAGKLFRYGRLRMQNALGPASSVLPVPIEAQYWNGSLFVRNLADGCTTLPQANINLADFRLNLGAGETTVTSALVGFTAGSGNLALSAPGAANSGSVLVTPDLVAAGRAYLQGAWTGSDYDDNPSARATFGLFGAQPRNFIYFRENY
jgi:hypothetical protein